MEVSDQSQSDGGEVEGAGDLVQEAYIYLTERRYPSGFSDSQKQSIRKKAGKFVVRDGEMLFKKKRKGKVRRNLLCLGVLSAIWNVLV